MPVAQCKIPTSRERVIYNHHRRGTGVMKRKRDLRPLTKEEQDKIDLELARMPVSREIQALRDSARCESHNWQHGMWPPLAVVPDCWNVS